MAYRATQIGAMIQVAPEQIHEQLCELFRVHRGIGAVANEVHTNRTTVHRWCDKLIKAGYVDPRASALEPAELPAAPPAGQLHNSKPGHSLGAAKRGRPVPTPPKRRALRPLPPLGQA